MKQPWINIGFHQEMAAKTSMNLHLCVYGKCIDTSSVVISAVWSSVTSRPRINFILVAGTADFFKNIHTGMDTCVWAPWIRGFFHPPLFYNSFSTSYSFSLRKLLCGTRGPWILQENRIIRNKNLSITFLWSQTVQRPNYEINESTREPIMPTRPILQKTGMDLHDYKSEPDRFKTPIMSTSIDEAQNPELAKWSDAVWQTEQWLIWFKNYSATNVTSLCQSVNLPSKPVFSCSKWPWTSHLPMNCRYTQELP